MVFNDLQKMTMCKTFWQLESSILEKQYLTFITKSLLL